MSSATVAADRQLKWITLYILDARRETEREKLDEAWHRADQDYGFNPLHALSTFVMNGRTCIYKAINKPWFSEFNLRNVLLPNFRLNNEFGGILRHFVPFCAVLCHFLPFCAVFGVNHRVLSNSLLLPNSDPFQWYLSSKWLTILTRIYHLFKGIFESK